MSSSRNPQAVGEWFSRRAALSPRRKAISFAKGEWTYEDLFQRIARTADALYSDGVRAGDRVGLLTFNRPEVLVILFAAARIGAISVPVNFRLTASEVKYIIGDSGLSHLLVGPEHVEIVKAIEPTLSLRQIIAFDAAGETGWPEYEAWASASEPAPAADAAPSDVCTILYTSGTTGVPKGAMITHDNIWNNNLNWIFAFGVGEDDVLLSVAPMFHAGGLFAAVLAVLMQGGCVVLQPNFDPAEYLRAIEESKVTVTFGVPTMILALSQNEGFAVRDLSSLRYLIIGGAPAPESLVTLCARRGIPITNAYGMTEATSVATLLDKSLALTKFGSVGRSVMLGEMRLVDLSGREVTEANVKAEVQLRGKHLFAGYWGLPEATRAAFVGDWFASGDVGYLDEGGFLYVCDRLKDMIITGGENVYAAEVESVILEHAAVLNVAVVGVPDPKWGENVAAVVVLKPSSRLDLEGLRTFCGPRLARYKLPQLLCFADALPLNGAGKIMKSEVRRIAANQAAAS
jgi:fatty-acyl-CoA synthase